MPQQHEHKTIPLSTVDKESKEQLDDTNLSPDEVLKVLRTYVQYKSLQPKDSCKPVRLQGTYEVWDLLNDINGIGRGKKGTDCIEGHKHEENGESIEWSYVLPQQHSEHHTTITAQILLRIIGVAHLNDCRLALWKESFKNSMPLPRWMAKLNHFEVGGIAFIGTKKCLWRQCVIAMARLYEEACAEPDKDREAFEASKLLEHWSEVITEVNLEARGNIGRAYLKEFKEDYQAERLDITLKIWNKTREPIFENHFIVIKNDTDPIIAAEVKVTQRELPYKYGYTLETLKWTPAKAGGVKNIPQSTETKRQSYLGNGFLLLDQNISHPFVGPIMFVPFEPIASTLHYYKVIQRLMLEEGYTIEEGGDLHQLMELAQLFLHLAKDLWEVKFPSWFGETLPPMPGTSESSICKRINTTPFKLYIEEVRKAKDTDIVASKKDKSGSQTNKAERKRVHKGKSSKSSNSQDSQATAVPARDVAGESSSDLVFKSRANTQAHQDGDTTRIMQHAPMLLPRDLQCSPAQVQSQAGREQLSAPHPHVNVGVPPSLSSIGALPHVNHHGAAAPPDFFYLPTWNRSVAYTNQHDPFLGRANASPQVPQHGSSQPTPSQSVPHDSMSNITWPGPPLRYPTHPWFTFHNNPFMATTPHPSPIQDPRNEAHHRQTHEGKSGFPTAPTQHSYQTALRQGEHNSQIQTQAISP